MQMDLFSSVLHAYADREQGPVTNQEVYETVGRQLNLSEEEMHARVPIGKSGE